MIKKVFAFMLVSFFVLNAAVFADTKKPKSVQNAVQVNKLAALLPPSDGAAFIDVQRLLNEVLPQIMTTNPPKLAEINAHLDAVKTQIGLDVRQFEQIAVGLAFREKEVEPTILARGKFNAATLLAMAKLGAKDKFREEKIGDKSVLIFPAREILAAHKAQMSGGGALVKVIDFVLGKMPAELAVTNFDANTLVLGLPARVRETIESKIKISPNVLTLMNGKPTAPIRFGVNTPNGLAQFFDLEDDEFGQSLASIRQLSGAMSVGGGNAAVSITAKSLSAEQAKSLEETLVMLQGIGKGLLAGAKSDDKKIYAKLLENLKVTRTAMQVMLDTQVPNADIAALIK